MKNKITLLLIALSFAGFSQTGTKLSLSQLQYASGGSQIIGSDLTGKATWTNTIPFSMITGTSSILFSTSSYTNPSWISSLAWSKITGTPTTISGYGITDPLIKGSLTSGHVPTSVSSTSLTDSPIYTTSLVAISNTVPVSLLSVYHTRTATSAGSDIDAVNIGGQYSNSNGNHLKMVLYDDMSTKIGFGVSAGRLDYQTGTNNIGHAFYLGASPVMVIGGNATDNVGIGTVSPAEKLEVNGYVKATGFKIPSGTSSQFLLADGSYTTISTGSTTAVTGTNNITVTGSAPNYTVGVQSSPTFTTTTLTGITTLSTTNLTGSINELKGSDIASSATTAIGASTGNYLHITGTVTINNFDVAQAGTMRTTVFDNTLTVTSSTNIVMPDNYNIVTAAGDIAIWRSEGGGVWNLVNYQIKSNSWFPWTTTFTGFSANPAGYTFRYTLVGKMCTCYYVGAAGTSNATSFTMTLPFVAANTVAQSFSVLITDAGTSTAGFIRTRVNSNVMDVYKGPSFNAFTASGNKSVTFSSFTYEIQ